MSSIFVNICSYRDPLLIHTLKNMMETESGNHHIVYGIFEQRLQPGSLQGRYPELANHPRVKYKRIDPEYTDGLGWSRHINSLQFRDEDLYYQTDSHMLFDEGWDQAMVEDYEMGCKEYSTDKVIITGCCKTVMLDGSGVPYRAEPKQDRWTCETKFHGLYWDSTPAYFGDMVPAKNHCAPAYMIWGGNTLFPKRYVKEIGFDPNMGFRGEQSKITLEAFANGYKLLHPRDIVAYHYNGSGDNYWTKPEVNPVVPQWKLDEMRNMDTTKFWEYVANLDPKILEDYRRMSGFDFIEKTTEKRSYSSKVPSFIPFKLIDDRLD